MKFHCHQILRQLFDNQLKKQQSRHHLSANYQKYNFPNICVSFCKWRNKNGKYATIWPIIPLNSPKNHENQAYIAHLTQNTLIVHFCTHSWFSLILAKYHRFWARLLIFQPTYGLTKFIDFRALYSALGPKLGLIQGDIVKFKHAIAALLFLICKPSISPKVRRFLPMAQQFHSLCYKSGTITLIMAQNKPLFQADISYHHILGHKIQAP